MIKEIKVCGRIHARVRVPGSKSLTNRALICASLAKGRSRLHNYSESHDTTLMKNGLDQLGILVTRQGDALVVDGNGGKMYSPKFPIVVGNAGTTFRFLISLAALADSEVAFETDARMSERPMSGLLDALRQLGTESSLSKMRGRMFVTGGTFLGGEATVEVEETSQFLSSLLMVAPYATQDVRLEIKGTPGSFPYIAATIDVMRRFGVEVEFDGGSIFRILAGQRYVPIEFEVEPDASSASYFLAAAAISGGEICVEGMQHSLGQGDAKFLQVLEQMGCEVVAHQEGVIVKSTGELRGIDVDCNAMPDIVPTLAVVALFAKGTTSIRNIAHLAYKESDRLDALATELKKAGAIIQVGRDFLEITPSVVAGAQFDTYDDHRLAMAFSLIGLMVSDVKIENPDCVKKSFPSYWREFEKLYQPK